MSTYNDDLLFALRMRDVPGPRIAEALAEVDSHVSESGEDPVEAFGPPKAYAAELAAALGSTSTPVWRLLLDWRNLVRFAVGAAGGLLLVNGVLSLFDEGRGLSSAAILALGGAMLAGLVATLLAQRKDQDAVRDPRTGENLAPPPPRWLLPLVVACGAMLVAAIAAGVWR